METKVIISRNKFGLNIKKEFLWLKYKEFKWVKSLILTKTEKFKQIQNYCIFLDRKIQHYMVSNFPDLKDWWNFNKSTHIDFFNLDKLNLKFRWKNISKDFWENSAEKTTTQ